MTFKARVSILFVLVALGSCSDPAARWTGTVQTTETTRQVVNPIRGIAEEGELTLQDLWSYSGPAEGLIWEVPGHIRVGPDEVYVVDPAASRVHVVGRDGKPLPSFGSRGQGPGEYSRLTDVIPIDSRLLVVDGGNARIEVLDESHQVVSSYPTGRLLFRVIPWGTDGILAYGMLGANADWQQYSSSGAGAVVDIPELEDRPSDDDSSCTQTSSHLASAVLLRCASPDIYIYSAAGELVEHFSIPFKVELVTDEELERLVSSMRKTMAGSGLPTAVMEQQVERMRNQSRIKPLVRKVSIDDASGLISVWQQNPEAYGGGPASIHFLSRSGIYLASFTFDTAWADFELVDGILYSLAKDPDTDQVSLEARTVDMAQSLIDRVHALG